MMRHVAHFHKLEVFAEEVDLVQDLPDAVPLGAERHVFPTEVPQSDSQIGGYAVSEVVQVLSIHLTCNTKACDNNFAKEQDILI